MLRQILAIVKPTTTVTIVAKAILVVSGVAEMMIASKIAKNTTEAIMLRLHLFGGLRGRFVVSFMADVSCLEGRIRDCTGAKLVFPFCGRPTGPTHSGVAFPEH